MLRIYRITILLIMIMMAYNGKASHLITLNIQHIDGTNSRVAVTQTLEITFFDELIQFASSEGSISYSISQVKSWEYEIITGDTGITEIKVPTIVIDNGLVQIESATTRCALYDLNGRMVTNIVNGGYININDLSPGIYILKLEDRTIKIRK